MVRIVRRAECPQTGSNHSRSPSYGKRLSKQDDDDDDEDKDKDQGRDPGNGSPRWHDRPRRWLLQLSGTLRSAYSVLCSVRVGDGKWCFGAEQERYDEPTGAQ